MNYALKCNLYPQHMEHLSLLHFLPQAMTEAFLSSPTALCLKLITPFKDEL